MQSLSVPSQAKHKAVKLVLSNVKLNYSYFLLIIASSTIATIGLLQNSEAAVIGAMILSPIFWPIIGLGVGILEGKQADIKKSALSFFVGIGVIILISYLISYIVPTDINNQQITSRIQPSLLDLLIALASAAVATIAIINPKFTNGAGVAISISLLPPLCVVGIELAHKSINNAAGALLLFTTNMIAILFTGLLIFYFVGIVRKSKKSKNIFKLSISLTVVLMIILSIPLAVVLYTQIKHSYVKSKVIYILNTNFKSINKNTEVEVRTMTFPNIWESKIIKVKAQLILPEGVDVSELTTHKILKQLTDETEYTVELNLDIINTISLTRLNSQANAKLYQQIEDTVTQKINDLPAKPVIEKIQTFINNEKNKELTVVATIKNYGNSTISFEDKSAIQEFIVSKFNLPIQLQIELANYSVLSKEQSQLLDSAQIQLLTTQITKDLNLISSKIMVDKVYVSKDSPTSSNLTLNVVISKPQNLTITYDQRQNIVKNIVSSLKQQINVEFKVINYTSF